MAINKIFMGSAIYKPGGSSGMYIPLDAEEEAVFNLFKTCERFGIIKSVQCRKYMYAIVFITDELSIRESHEEFKARFRAK